MTAKELNHLFKVYESSPTKLIKWLDSMGISTKGLNTTISLHRNAHNRISKSWAGLYKSYFLILEHRMSGAIRTEQMYLDILGVRK